MFPHSLPLTASFIKVILLPHISNRLNRFHIPGLYWRLLPCCYLFSKAMHFVSAPAKANTPVRTDSTTSSISLQWDEVDEGSLPRTYFVSWMPVSTTGSTSSTAQFNSFTTRNLQSNAAYTFRVLARNQVAGNGEFSNPVTFHTSMYY